jgi:hypothetical protein
MEEPEKLNHIDELQKKLYSKHYIPKNTRVTLSNKNYNIDNDWNAENNNRLKPINPNANPNSNSNDLNLSQNPNNYWGPGAEPTQNLKLPKQFPVSRGNNRNFIFVLIFAVVFFLGSLAYAGFIFLGGGKNISADEVSVNVIGPVSIGGGEKLSLDVVVQNNNAVPLELVDLVIDYPAGTKNADDLMTDLKRDRIPLGDLSPGQISRKTVSSALFGEENSTQEITLTLQYRISGSNAVFEKQKKTALVLSASPVRLVVDGLKEISSGQEIELTTRLSSNSSKTLENVMMTAKYPFGFALKSSSIKATIDNNIWIFNKVEPGEEQIIKLIGTISGQNEESRVFRFNTGIKSETVPDEIGIVWGTILHETVVKKSFADLKITLNNQDTEKVAINSGQTVFGQVSFYNNTNDILRNVKIELELDGDILNDKTVEAENAFYRSSDNTIFWNSETGSIFSEIKPRASLELPFKFASYNMEKGQNVLNNPEIKLSAKISGIRVSESNTEESLVSDTFAIAQIKTDIPVSVYTVYSEGPFTNSGNIPPKPETKTRYTIVFEVSNSTNNLQNTMIEAIIPSYVDWNNMFSPQNSNVYFDSETRRMSWDAGIVNAGVGYVTPPKKMYVNVTLNPSVSQIGTAPELMRNVKITAFDSFTKINITKDLPSPTTIIKDRSTGDRHQFVTE